MPEVTLRACAVQEPPVYMNMAATLERGAELVRQAAKDGSRLVVFPEAWVPGYLDWVWALAPSNDSGDFDDSFRLLWDNAVDLVRDDLAPIRDAAAETGTVVVIGVNERSEERSGGTLYNTGVIIDADGGILNAHRKLMPTNPEREAWGFGDGRSLRVVDSAIGRVGVLLCWESFMPMARMALYAQNMDILCVPTAHHVEANDVSMRHFGKEGGCAVISACNILRTEDVAEDHPARGIFESWGDWVSPGGAILVQPGGDIAAGPMRGEEGMLTGDIDLALVRTAKRTFDPAGHYSRPDVFELLVDRKSRSPVTYLNAE